MTTRPTSIADYLSRYRIYNPGKSPLEELLKYWDDAYAEGRTEGLAASQGTANAKLESSREIARFYKAKAEGAYSEGRASGYADGYAEGASGCSLAQGAARFWEDKFKDLLEVARAAYDAGQADGMSKKIELSNAEQSAKHPDTESLINELYRDRNRLKRVVADAVSLAQLAEDTIDMLRKTATFKEADGIDSALVLGSLSQFQDTHGDD